MYFGSRKLKPYSEPVDLAELKETSIYFLLNFVDEEMLYPVLQPVVYVGNDLETGDVGRVYFQDLESFQQGVRYDTITEDNPAIFFSGAFDELGHIFEYEQALEVLMACSLRRKSRASDV